MFQQMNPYYNQFQYPYPNQFPTVNQNQFITKQVSNIEEAKACLIDPLSTYLFIDMNSGKIYLKRMNNNGLSDFYTFTAEQNETNKIDPLSVINERLKNIENILGGKINVQSIPNDAEFTESKSNDFPANEKSEPTAFQQGSRNDERKNRNRN